MINPKCLMKKIFYILCSVLAAALFITACSKEKDINEAALGENSAQEEVSSPALPGETITITVGAPEDIPFADTKVGFEYADNKLSLTWEDDDILVVKNASSESQFTISSLSANRKTATFTGTAPGAGPYTIFYGGKGTAKTLDEIEALAFGEQTQSANDNTSHLKFGGVLTGVDTYEDIVFTPEWAAEHNGTYKQSGVLRIQLQNPGNILSGCAIASISLQAPSAIFPEDNAHSANLDKITVNFSTPVPADATHIIAYAMLPWSDTNLTLPAGDYLVTIKDDKYDSWIKTKTFASASALSPTSVNTLQLNKSGLELQPFYGGTGVSGDPYLIGNGRQLDSLHNHLVANQVVFAKLMADIDMSSIAWSSLNSSSPYKKIDFDGNNKTISNLVSSLFYVFSGSARNLVLDQCQSASGTQRGVFAQYIQTTGHSVTNVDVTNSIVSSGNNVGALIGRINSGSDGTITATITDCDISNTTVAGTVAGGLIGSVEAEVAVSNCTVSGGSVTGSSANDGGLIGNMTKATTITDCSVTGTDVTGGSVVGGLVGFANGLITMSGCTYSGGTVSTAGRYLGGTIGSTANVASVISDCHVENATISSTNTDDARCGGFVGQLQTSVQIKGCTVGTDAKKVVVNTAKPASGKVLNAGGFVGVNYGTITKNGDVRSKAYVQVTSANDQGQQINVGGFAGFHRGTIEYSDAVVDMSDLQGQYIGGFSGYMPSADSKADNCTLKGSVRGNNYTGGFVGVVDNADSITNCEVLEGTVVVGQSTAGGFAAQIKAGTIEDCSAHVDLQCRGGNDGGFVGALTGGTVQKCSSAGTLSQISSSNTVFGGFAGYVNGVDLRKCSSTVDISVARSYVGGLVGDFQTANTVSECFYNGTISGPTNTKGGLIGTTQAVAVVITNCYTAGELVGSSGTQIYGGIVGELKAGGSVTNCYSTMDMTHGARAMGGIVGRACSGGWPVSNESGNTISKCIAWNPAITYDGTASSSASSGAIVGYTSFKNILNNCYRRYDMLYKNSNTAVGTSCQTSMVDQIDCDGTNWLINGSRPAGGAPAGTSADAQYQAPYYGVAAASTATVSSIAQSLGWDSTVWDFTGDLPTLK